MSDFEIKAQRFPSRFAIAMDVAPLVRNRIITSDEGDWLVEHRYVLRLAELASEEEGKAGA